MIGEDLGKVQLPLGEALHVLPKPDRLFGL